MTGGLFFIFSSARNRASMTATDCSTFKVLCSRLEALGSMGEDCSRFNVLGSREGEGSTFNVLCSMFKVLGSTLLGDVVVVIGVSFEQV